MKDVYFSRESLLTHSPFDGFYNVALINGEWKPYTEIIDEGKKALSVYKDLIFIGKSNTFRRVNL